MDGQLFDDIARAVAAGTSRRRVVKGLVGGAVGAVAGAVGLRRAGAIPITGSRSYGCTCSSGFECRTGFCRVYPNGHGRCLCPNGAALCRDQLEPGSETCRNLQADPGNCGACGNPCAQGQTCVDGRCGGAPCPNAVLSGGPSATASVHVDDDLQVFLNGVSVFDDGIDTAHVIPPITLGAASNGDQLRVVASNHPSFCGNEFLSPLYLHCPATGAVQILDADGFPAANGGCGEVFYDTTFAVAL